MSATNKWQFYAESTLFQSPPPSKLPIPVFDKDGHFVPGPWPITDNSLSSTGDKKLYKLNTEK